MKKPAGLALGGLRVGGNAVNTGRKCQGKPKCSVFNALGLTLSIFEECCARLSELSAIAGGALLILVSL